jgi:hypothetical protein
LSRNLQDTKNGKALPRSRMQLHLFYDEDAMIQNIGRATSMGSLRTTETCHLLTATDLCLPRRKRINYSGSNFSDHCGPIAPEVWEDEDMFVLTRKEKNLGSAPPGLKSEARRRADSP